MTAYNIYKEMSTYLYTVRKDRAIKAHTLAYLQVFVTLLQLEN